MNLPLSSEAKLTNNSEVIVNSLSDPNVIDVNIVNDAINFEVRKEMGIEVIGDTKIKVSTSDDFDDYIEIFDDEINDAVLQEIDDEVNEDYLTTEKAE